MSVAKKREPGPEGTWAQRFLASCSAVGQKACTEVGRHPFRTVYISAVAQRGRNSQLYPFQGHFSGIFSINEREGPTGLLKGAGKKTRLFGATFILKMMILPRQARYKHRETQQRNVFSQRTGRGRVVTTPANTPTQRQ